MSGSVLNILDANFGIIGFVGSGVEKALIKLSEVWLSHESTAANRGLELDNVLSLGAKVIFSAVYQLGV